MHALDELKGNRFSDEGSPASGRNGIMRSTGRRGLRMSFTPIAQPACRDAGLVSTS